MNNINPFLNNRINSRQNVANQNNGALNYNVRFGNGQNYDSFESSSNEKTKSFWQKWKGIIIGGAGLLCVSILGVIGYNKGWFKKASDKIKDKTGETASKTASNAPKNVLNLETSLKTLKISSQSFNGRTINDMIKKGNISKRELQAVTTKLKNIKNKENKENQAAVIFILNQLRQHLDDSVQIEGFRKEDAKEINGTNLDKILENIIKEPIPSNTSNPSGGNVIKEEESKPLTLSGSSGDIGGDSDSDVPSPNPPVESVEPTQPAEPTSPTSNTTGGSVTRQESTISEETPDDYVIKEKPKAEELEELEKLATSQPLTYIKELNAAWNIFNTEIPLSKSQKASAVADALNAAIQGGSINNNNDDDKQLVQGTLTQFKENNVITQKNARNVADALNSAIRHGFINNENDDDKKLVEGILTQLKENITTENTYSVAYVLIIAKTNGVVNDDTTTYNEMIKRCINANAMDVALALEHIILIESINKNNNNGVVQGILSKFNEKDVIKKGNARDVADVLFYAIDRRFIDINNSTHKQLVQGILSKFNEKDVITKGNADNVALALKAAIQCGLINNNEEHKEFVQDIIKRLKNSTISTTCSNLEELINLAKNKGFINDDDIKKLQQE